jgi:four helix bundle protein
MVYSNKITSFTDLNTWKEAHKLVLDIYKLIKKFPKEEKYALSDQMRRCAVSITSNIAEGFSRQGKKEKLQFYYTSKGSLTELQNQLLIAKDAGYLNDKIFKELADQTVTVGKLLTGLIKSAQKK